jgi:hypothetical protein
VQIKFLSVVESPRNLVIPVHPVRFSVVHVVGSVGIAVKPVFPERLTVVSLVEADKNRVVTVEGRPVSDVIFGGVVRLVTDAGIVGNVISAVHPVKFNAVVSDGIPMIEVRAALVIVNELGKPVHPVRFSVVHDAGNDGSAVKAVFPVRSSVINLVHPTKFNDVVFVGIPMIEVRDALEIINDSGNLVQSVSFSVVHVGGSAGSVVKPASPVRSTVVRLVHFDKSNVFNLPPTILLSPASDSIFEGGTTLVMRVGIVANAVNPVE